ncbi:glycosyltransferase family 4 protein [Myxococcota bacterium]|nr:glycosyltransferase family 4 protein [Myxococcota bacterium]
MRILFSNGTRDWGGEKTWAIETASFLQGQGHACAVLGRLGDPWVEACAQQGLESHGIRFGPAIFNPVGLFNYFRVARAFAPDCILVNISRDMCAGAVAGALLGIPVLRHVGLAEDLNHDPVDWWLHRQMLTHTIAVGHQMKREMLEKYRWLEAESVEVIHIGKDITRFTTGSRRDLRDEWGIPRDALLVGVTSQLEEKKGHTVLFEALARPSLEGLHLVVVGRGGNREALEATVDALGLRGRVHFLGFRRDIEAVLCNLDIFALPSLNEGFPNSLVEAMATGRPSISTDLACVSEILQDGINGLLVPPGDAASLANALETMAGDPVTRARMAAAARKTVEESFSLEATAMKTASLVSRCVAEYAVGRSR